MAPNPEPAQRLDVPDGALCVEVAGEGLPVVLLHGFGGDRATWDTLWPGLCVDHRCVRYDMRGFGASIHIGEQSFSHVDDLIAVLDALEIDRAVLVGVSQGGAVAIDAALAHAGRVAGLVLISPAISGWAWTDDWRNRWRNIVSHARAGRMDEARNAWWAHPLFDSLRDTPAAPAYLASIMRYSGREWLRDYQSAPPSPAFQRESQLTAPILLLGGRRDVSDFVGIHDNIAAHAANCRQWMRADLGHMVHLEDPAWTLDEIENFLNEIG